MLVGTKARRTVVLVCIRILGIQKKEKKEKSGGWGKNRAILCGTAVINLWDFLKYDILLRKSFHSDESSSSNFTNFLPSGSHASRAEELPMLSY